MMNMDGSWELARYILSSDSLLRNDDASTFLGSNKVFYLNVIMVLMQCGLWWSLSQLTTQVNNELLEWQEVEV